MKKICKTTGKTFEITEDDLKFYEKMGVPTPTLCPEERQRRRLSWRNERNLYHRVCDITGKKIISIYSPDKLLPVYEKNYWWSDKWDGRKYGRDFDFSRPFFEQFLALQKVIPRPSLHVVGNENCDFVNQCGFSKDCYLSFNTDYSESCFFCSNTFYSSDCLDSLHCEKCELCYECLDCKNCYASKFLKNCKNCSESYFLKNCIGCSDCFGCVNLRNKQYYFLNEKCTKEKYFKKLSDLKLEKYSSLKSLRKNFSEFIKKYPCKFVEILNVENVSGDYLNNCKNAKHCFDSFDSENISYCAVFSWGKDCMDFDVGGYESELCYETASSGGKQFDCAFMANCWTEATNLFYSELMIRIKHCFGCIGLKSAQYCILNKQYSKEEYFQLRDKIIDHMKKTKEWGEFFPIEISPFAYNETMAQEYFPLTKEEALAKGYKWKEKEETIKHDGPKYEIPDNIKDVSDEILEKVLICENTGKNYRIIKVELDFYRKMNIF